MQEAALYQQIIQLTDSTFEQYIDLPFAVCLFSLDGTFLKYNEQGQHLFGLPLEVTFTDNIKPFFIHPDDYHELIERLHLSRPGEWLSEITIDLTINQCSSYVRNTSQAVWDEEQENVIGLISLLSNSTNSARYHHLFSELPVGIFALRDKEGLINANTRFVEMHGFSTFEEIKNKPVEFFINDIVEVKELEHKVRKEGKVVNQLQEHKCKDGTVFTAAISATATYGNNGQPIGMEGFVKDVSNEDIYFKMVDNVPMGLYKIQIDELGKHILVHCNQQFAEHLGASYPNELIGRDIRLFHRTEDSFLQFHNQLVQKDREGLQLIDHIVELVDLNGRLRRHEVHSNLLKDVQGNIIGRVGAERDVTDLWETRQQLNELTTDIGKVLHSYSSTLIHSKHSMDAVTRALVSPEELSGPRNQFNVDKTFERIQGKAAALNTIFKKVFEKSKNLNQIDESALQNLSRLIDLIQPRSNTFDMRQLALIRDGAIKIKEMIRPLFNYNLPKEWLKQIRRQLDEILRLCSLLTLSAGIDAILEMETNVNNLRSYILTRVKPKEKPKRLNLYDLLIGVIQNITEYASKRNIELKLNAKSIRNLYTEVYEIDLVRALLNILHNAVKYSWVRKGPAKAYVQIAGKADAEWIYISVENWGVAITEKEIQQGLIFNVGYRGTISSDRRRPGTGLGLYDAQKVIEKHHGQLSISSSPSLGNAKNDYSKPFVTTVNIKLPRNNSQ